MRIVDCFVSRDDNNIGSSSKGGENMSTLMYVAENFYRGTCIPVHVYSPEEKKEICCYGFSDAADPFKTDDALFPQLFDSYFPQGRPWIHLEMDFFVIA
ncbi:MAG: hypothetical protein LUC95_07185 [Lachnospiraceae bacterium]|nr:hypothetical protein [Lachnospiraceae bacterium]